VFKLQTAAPFVGNRRPTPMSLECTKLANSSEFVKLLQDNCHGQDFWLSCQANLASADFTRHIQSVRVESNMVAEIFTHCYFTVSSDIKADADAVLVEVGLGLRRKTVRSKNVSGCVFLLVKETAGPTTLMQEKSGLSADDHKLSAEERLRRTELRFEVADLEHMATEAKRSRTQFWLTSWTATNVEDGMKKVVCMRADGELAVHRFKRCWLAEVADCLSATERLTASCGHGLRKGAVRSRPGPGCVALLLSGEGPPPPAPVATPPRRAAAASPEARAAPEGQSQAKRRRVGPEGVAAVPMLPIRTSSSSAAKASTTSTPRPSPAGATPTSGGSGSPLAANGAVPTTLAGPSSEEIYIKTLEVLERRLAALLPTLPREQLSTPLVQEKLEESMRKPHGRLDKFKLEIARIWRKYLETTAGQTEDVD